MESVELEDGQRVCLRPLRADDTERMHALFDRLSGETARRRFLVPVKDISPRELQRLAAVDHRNQEALAAVCDCDENGPIVAIARYARTEGQRAELAVVVQDDYQRLGLGRLMLDHLIALGRRNGIVELHGETLTDNTPMLNLLRSTGLPLRTALTGSVYRFRLALGGGDQARAED